MIDRRRLTLKDKLEIIVRQARCPRCGEKLGVMTNLEFDHAHALARGGGDTNDNMVALHVECHREKTSGTASTSRGSDVHEIAKTKRLAREEEAFRARILAKEPGAEKPRSRWPNRKMQTRRTP